MEKNTPRVCSLFKKQCELQAERLQLEKIHLKRRTIVTNELVVDVQPKEVTIALLEDKSLVELQSEGRNISFSVGNMYLGRIRKLMPGLNACFVDVGYEKDAFLHYQDLGLRGRGL